MSEKRQSSELQARAEELAQFVRASRGQSDLEGVVLYVWDMGLEDEEPPRSHVPEDERPPLLEE